MKLFLCTALEVSNQREYAEKPGVVYVVESESRQTRSCIISHSHEGGVTAASLHSAFVRWCPCSEASSLTTEGVVRANIDTPWGWEVDALVCLCVCMFVSSCIRFYAASTVESTLKSATRARCSSGLRVASDDDASDSSSRAREPRFGVLVGSNFTISWPSWVSSLPALIRFPPRPG